MKSYLQLMNYPHGTPQRAYAMSEYHIAEHFHLDVECVGVTKGSLRITLAGKTWDMGPGDLVVFPSRVGHSLSGHGKNNRFIISIFEPQWVGFPGGWPSTPRHASAFLQPIRCRETRGLARKALDEIMAALEGMVRETVTPQTDSPLLLRGETFRVVGLLSRFFMGGDAGAKGAMSPHDDQIENLLAHLDAHFCEPITLGGIAEKLDMGKSHLSHIFSKRFGIGFADYLAKRRLRHASLLLTETASPIAEIALACGFDSIRTFNRAFQDEMKMSPTAWRRKQVTIPGQ